MNPASSRFLKSLVAASIIGVAVSAPRAHAQAQSLLSSNQVVVSRVENVTPTAILISGVNFDKFKAPLVVSLSGSGTAVTTIPAVYNATSKDITATLPDNVAWIPGSYRLMVSFGSGTAGTDVFEFTVGAVGPKGDKGLKGDKGDKGDQGVQGIQGLKGDKGDKGDQGIQGIQGIQGVQGAKGDQGIQGLKGDKGDKGDQGIQGIQGEKGDKGDQGIQGVQGIQGLKGETGAQGLKGDKGDKGDTGLQGIQGLKGDTGAQGPKGDKGDKGDTGATGAQGPIGTIGQLPTFQNVNEARDAGIAVGQLWVQESSGQVFQMAR